jgi:UDP-N-acetylmuramyl pentapeptide phosphotransferase/UDP-N-acetylglucosamine-1-phosphate transferase
MTPSWLTAWLLTAAWFAVAFLGALIGTGLVLRILRRRAILDHPNERSSHAVPTPHGGGIALVFVLLPAWAVIALGVPGQTFIIWLVLGAALLLAGVSWADDLTGISRSIRFAAHIAAVSLVLSALPGDAFLFQGVLPLALDRLAAGILWVWFINLFNFMDGIDGIAGAEVAAIGFGLFLIAFVAGAEVQSLFGLTLAATALGFLWWNWHPAQVFLGDVGSVPLGYLLGWLLLEAALKGFWAAALILPLYYLADATITLLRRLLSGERIWQAHAQHFYQRAVRRGLSHATVVRIILLANGVLIVLALLAAGGAEITALLGALLTVAALLTVLARWRGGGGAGDGAPGEGSDR